MVGLAQRDPSDQLLQVVTALAKLFAQLFQQFGMRRRIVRSEVVNRLGESVTQELRPHAIDDHLVQKLALQHQPAKLLATIDVADIPADFDRRAVGEDRIGDSVKPFRSS